MDSLAVTKEVLHIASNIFWLNLFSQQPCHSQESINAPNCSALTVGTSSALVALVPQSAACKDAEIVLAIRRNKQHLMPGLQTNNRDSSQAFRLML